MGDKSGYRTWPVPPMRHQENFGKLSGSYPRYHGEIPLAGNWRYFQYIPGFS